MPACLECGKDLPAPRMTANGKNAQRFCSGSRCRSAWHLAQRRKKIAEIQTLMGRVLELVEELTRSGGAV